MHIGLIGGIGPAATDFYYRRLISTFASQQAALGSGPIKVLARGRIGWFLGEAGGFAYG